MAENFGSFIKKHAEAQAQNIEYLKSIAESQIGGEKYNTKDIISSIKTNWTIKFNKGNVIIISV